MIDDSTSGKQLSPRGKLWRSWFGMDDHFIFGGTVLGWNLVGILGGLLGISVLLVWIFSSYLGIDVAASVSFRGADGWCDTPAEGIGVHCFGDFAAIQFTDFGGIPLAPELVYPLSNRILRIPFAIIQSVAGFQPALITFLVASALALLAPIVWAVRFVPLSMKLLVVGVAGLATAPFLVAWDRGNALNLALPLIFLAFIALARDKPWLASIAIIGAASVKPQFALVAFALIALRRWLPALVGVLGSAGIVIGTYFVRGADWLSGIVQWLNTASAWSASQSLATNWPTNLSFPKLVYLAAHAGPWGRSSFITAIPDSAYTYIAGTGLAAVVIAILAAGPAMPRLVIASALLVIASLALPLAYPYYSILALPIFALLFRNGRQGWPPPTRLSQSVLASLAIATVLTMTPLFVPLGAGSEVPHASLVPLLSTASWGLFLVLSGGWAVLLRIRRSPAIRVLDDDWRGLSTSRAASPVA